MLFGEKGIQKRFDQMLVFCRVTNKTSFYNYSYHLGNTRVVVDKTGDLIQEDNYYPFGMEIPDPLKNISSSPKNKYLYNGKELQDEYGLNQYDYGARFYDPVIGRWNGLDPLMEKYPNWSPYNYCMNNPINVMDIDGRDTTQRNTAIRIANQYVDNKLPGNQYKIGAKGKPGDKVDCSGLISSCVKAGGESDPNRGEEGSGVLNIESNSQLLEEKNVVAGNIVTFHFDKGYPHHIGLVTGATKDKDGNIISFTMIHSSSGTGPNEQTV